MGGPWRDAGPLRRMRRRHPPGVVGQGGGHGGGQGGADDEHPSWHWWASPGRGRTWCRARRNTSVPPVWVGAVPATGRGVAGASGLAAAAGAACPPMKATTVHRPHHAWRRGGRRRHRRRPRQRRQIYLFFIWVIWVHLWLFIRDAILSCNCFYCNISKLTLMQQMNDISGPKEFDT